MWDFDDYYSLGLVIIQIMLTVYALTTFKFRHINKKAWTYFTLIVAFGLITRYSWFLKCRGDFVPSWTALAMLPLISILFFLYIYNRRREAKKDDSTRPQ